MSAGLNSLHESRSRYRSSRFPIATHMFQVSHVEKHFGKDTEELRRRNAEELVQQIP